MLSHEVLKSLLTYIPETGEFIWRVRRSNVAAGTKAGSLSEGYIVLRIQGERYYGHRLAWFWMTGIHPSGEVDHKNRNRGDNRWKNLRVVSHGVNGRNHNRYDDDDFGLEELPSGNFRVRFYVNKRYHSYGTYKTKISAINCAKHVKTKLNLWRP